MSQTEQFSELITNIKYGLDKMKIKEWTRAAYYNYMADFFDYIDLPKDAEEHRTMAEKWEIDNKDKLLSEKPKVKV